MKLIGDGELTLLVIEITAKANMEKIQDSLPEA